MKPHLVPTPSPTPYERARAESKRHARETQLATLALGSEFVEQLRELASLGEDQSVCVQHDAPLVAAKLSADIARMLASVRGEGRIR